MIKKDYNKVLSHDINKKVQKMMNEVISYFPNKKLLIHPISIAEQEIGERYGFSINGLTKPSLDKYVGIWINEKLSTKEFNLVLAEELYHNIQAYKKYSYPDGNLHDINQINFVNELHNTVLDLDAHHHLIKRGFDITPIQKLSYNARASARNIESDMIEENE